MAANKRSKTLSATTKALLQAGEGQRVDFKKVGEGLSAEDFVAFANSDGGQILVGVVEDHVDGAQVGVICGCDVSDGTILQITNKAISCLPPVSINVFLENLDSKPILRIEIPASLTKPHCTQKGIYCKRDGSRNRPLHPPELLRIFLDTEARAFSERFEAAADRITSELDHLESSLEASIENMSTQLGWADSKLGDTESNIQAILGMVHRIDGRSGKLSERMRTLFRQEKRKDPVADREFNKLVAEVIRVIDGQDDAVQAIAAGRELSVQYEGNLSEELEEGDLRLALNKAARQIYDREVRKMYAIVCRLPSKCSAEEIKDFCRLVAEGGEVGKGLKGRVEGALMLGFVVRDGAIVGTAALKKPTDAYRSKVFKKANSDVELSTYPYELGWVYLHPDHRGKGQMAQLLKALMKFGESSNVYATTRTNNEPMKKALLRLDFRPNGEPYPSEQHAEAMLSLFLRAGDASETQSAAIL